MKFWKNALVVLSCIVAFGGCVALYLNAEEWIQEEAEKKIKDVAIVVSKEVADSLITPLKQEIQEMKIQKMADDSLKTKRHLELLEAIQGERSIGIGESPN